MTGYNRTALVESYRRIGLEAGLVIYITGNLGRLGFPVDAQGEPVRDKRAIAMMHIEVIEEIIGPEGTIVFPTHSWGEVGTESVFDPLGTACDYFLSQCLLESREARRQVHPFASSAAIGRAAADIISDGLSPHAYSYDSPMASLAERNALHVSVGIPVARSISSVHYCEQVAQVPYRYVKAFHKDVRQNGNITREEVYLHVLYRTPSLVLERDHNKTIMALPRIASSLSRSPLGRSFVESVPLDIFIPETIRAMRRDPYIWLRSITGNRPWMR